jgi:hypothetical protein
MDLGGPNLPKSAGLAVCSAAVRLLHGNMAFNRNLWKNHAYSCFHATWVNFTVPAVHKSL